MTLIDVCGLEKIYTIGADVVNALDDVSVRIDPGEFVAITGQSGCGKSTLMNILGLLDRSDKGRYLFEHQSVDAMSDNETSKLRNEAIGFVFQDFNLLTTYSTLENVELPLLYGQTQQRYFSAQVRHEKAMLALKTVGLSNRARHKPNELSGGQKQRMAIARALINEPRLVLGDEPTGNLDSKTGNAIFELFEQLNDTGITILIVTHDHLLAQRCKRQIQMLDGKIIEDIRRP